MLKFAMNSLHRDRDDRRAYDSKDHKGVWFAFSYKNKHGDDFDRG